MFLSITHSLAWRTSECRFYNKKCERPSATARQCNSTKELCRNSNSILNFNPNDTFCHNLLVVDKLGNVTLMGSGCVMNLAPKCRQTTCKYGTDGHGAEHSVYFCCCQGDFCNDVSFHLPTVSPPTTTRISIWSSSSTPDGKPTTSKSRDGTEVISHGGNKFTVTHAIVVFPAVSFGVVLLAIFFACCFLFWRRRALTTTGSNHKADEARPTERRRDSGGTEMLALDC